MIVVFVNCSSAPFVDRMMAGTKTKETRTRNMLRRLIGQRVFIAETGHGRPPLVRCSLVFGEPETAETQDQWNAMRAGAAIPDGSRYDWQADTRKKFLYPITGVKACKPFVPSEGVRHGYVWMETNDN